MVKSGETVSDLCLEKLKHVANCKQNQINKRLEELELKIKDDQNPLNLAKKSPGPDGILNETIKSSKSVLNIFSTVLSAGHVPDIWTRELITPIFKNGDKCDPSNYRGTCVRATWELFVSLTTHTKS